MRPAPQGVKIDLKDGAGETALLIAATVGRLDAVETLLARGADANLASRDGRWPLATVIGATQRRPIPKSEAFSGGWLA